MAATPGICETALPRGQITTLASLDDVTRKLIYMRSPYSETVFLFFSSPRIKFCHAPLHSREESFPRNPAAFCRVEWRQHHF